ncbi:hypothetical protein GALMADRAFT_1175889 [Galerina marginata CBS 339.88]|uniref:Uncharacterized protein n=1 Tax=Galerina marginata (strain CBS 339.88) TaxID=685588 RepID=A0A067TCH5_GALM3|nr:hypothetical protein GALMADRAFT_1175889 [Galerina marginata CBS 339.88]
MLFSFGPPRTLGTLYILYNSLPIFTLIISITSSSSSLRFLLSVFVINPPWPNPPLVVSSPVCVPSPDHSIPLHHRYLPCFQKFLAHDNNSSDKMYP